MRRHIYLGVIILLLVLLVKPLAGQSEEGENPFPNIIRLHIVANSNTKNDQELKLIVRDKILAKLDLTEVEEEGQAWQYLEDNLEEIQDCYQELLEEQGYNYKSKAQLTIEDFPYREYGSQVYPPGKYQALKIVIGQGQGENWWCVLYPPLCHEALFDEVEDRQVLEVDGNIYKPKVKEKTEVTEIFELFLEVLKNIWVI